MKKYLPVLVFLLTFSIAPFFASAQTTSTFTKYVTLGQTDQDVKVLQQALNSLGYTVAPTGFGSPGNETSYYGPATTKAIQRFQCATLSICQGSPHTNGYGNFGPLTRRTLAQKYTGSSSAITPNTNGTITYPIIAYPTPTPTPTPSTGNTQDQNRNIGTITIRAIVANIDEVGNKYGSMGEKFTQSKLTETDSALQRLNTFVKQSAYGKAQLQWTTSGVYELGSGVCSHVAWSDKTDDLIQRALQAADSQTPLIDYSYYLIVHPMPDCQDGTSWSFEGRGNFKAYTINGRIVNLRGVRISDLSDEYLFHEFGHSLGYKPNSGIGHPDYLNCPVVTSNGETKISLSNNCPRVYDWNNGVVPVYTMMSAKRGILSDYNAPEKETIGWLTGSNIVTTTAGKYTLSPIEQTGSSPKALRIPIAGITGSGGTDYVVYVSFRQPVGYTYPSAPANKPNGVILDIAENNNISLNHFLTTNSTNMDAPLQIGVPYRIGTNGPVITLTGISNNLASITVSSGTIVPPDPTLTPVISFSSSPTSVSSGQSSALSWKVTNANRCVLFSGITQESVLVNGSKTVYPTQTTSYRLWCVNDPGTGKDGPSAEKTISVTVNNPVASASIDQNSLTSSSGMPTISGYAYNVTQPFGVSISNNGGKVWASGNIAVNNNRWSTTVNQTLSAGTYQVQVYSNNILVTNGTLTITSPAPTCSLYSNKSSYTLGETITYSWTSQNATYASFQQDTSGKDHLWLPGDKLPANGSQQVTASVIGNPPVTLLVGGVNNGIGYCSKTVNVTSNSLETVSFDQNALKVMPGTAFALSGGTSAKSGSFTVAVVGPNYSGATNWNTVGNLLKGGSSYTTVSKTVSLSGAGWTASFGSIGSEGYYTVLIYDGNYNLLGTATLWVTFKG